MCWDGQNIQSSGLPYICESALLLLRRIVLFQQVFTVVKANLYICIVEAITCRFLQSGLFFMEDDIASETVKYQ